MEAGPAFAGLQGSPAGTRAAGGGCAGADRKKNLLLAGEADYEGGDLLDVRTARLFRSLSQGLRCRLRGSVYFLFENGCIPFVGEWGGSSLPRAGRIWRNNRDSDKAEKKYQAFNSSMGTLHGPGQCRRLLEGGGGAGTTAG